MIVYILDVDYSQQSSEHCIAVDLQVYMLHGMGVSTGTNLDKLIEVTQ